MSDYKNQDTASWATQQVRSGGEPRHSQSSRKRRRRRVNPFLYLIFVLATSAILAGVGWQLYQLRDQVAAAQAEKERYETEVEMLRQENDALAADIAEGATEEKMEEVARKELGLVTQGEYVFSHRGS